MIATLLACTLCIAAAPPPSTSTQVQQLELDEGGQTRPECAPEVTLRRALVQYEGQLGLWFDLRVAKCMLMELKLLQGMRATLTLQDQAIELQRRQVASYEQAIALGKQSERTLALAIKAAEHRATLAEQEAAEAADWYPVWAGGGVAAGMLVTVLLVWAAK